MFNSDNMVEQRRKQIISPFTKARVPKSTYNVFNNNKTSTMSQLNKGTLDEPIS